jgi:hypothetical protein
MTAFTLRYRRGSFAQSAIFDSRDGALAGAYPLINEEGYHTFSIEDNGVVVLEHSQIQTHCDAARVAILSGRTPARSSK